MMQMLTDRYAAPCTCCHLNPLEEGDNLVLGSVKYAVARAIFTKP